MLLYLLMNFELERSSMHQGGSTSTKRSGKPGFALVAIKGGGGHGFAPYYPRAAMRLGSGALAATILFTLHPPKFLPYGCA